MKFINKRLNAFTLSELLIALGVIGILTAILLPIIFSMMPNQNTIMAKRAFATTQTVVSDLLNDINCYPQRGDRIGIDDGKGYSRCSGWGASASEDAGVKFAKLFTEKLDLANNVNITNGATTVDFATKDGMSWKFQSLNSIRDNVNSRGTYITLSVDVNGTGNNPDCGQANEMTKCSVNKGFDTFTMRIYESGKVQIIDGWAIEAVKTDKSLIGNEESDLDNVSTVDVVEENNTQADPCDKIELHFGDPCCQKEPYKSKRACSKCYDEVVENASEECCKNEWNFDTLDEDVQLACCQYDFEEKPICSYNSDGYGYNEEESSDGYENSDGYEDSNG